MKENFTVYVVDDDLLALEMTQALLDERYQVQCFNTVEDCQAQLEMSSPDMFLLDIRMPGVDGYEFCRLLKADSRWRHIPVTFVSAQDTIDARMAGYDAGGDDFIIKPFESAELLRKVRVVQLIVENARMVRQQLDDSELLSSLVMANMDEYAVLVRFLREVITCANAREVAECALSMLKRFGLEAVVQVRDTEQVLTLSERGMNLPLEASVLQHLRSMDRIFEFRNRSVHNFDHLTLMINNMPVHDSDLCGRLRDHLCIAAECAEARLQAIESEAANRRHEQGIRHAMLRIQGITSALTKSQMENTTASSDLLLRFENTLAKSFINLGLTDGQERELGDVVTGFTEELLKLVDHGITSHEPLFEISRQLEMLVVQKPVNEAARV